MKAKSFHCSKNGLCEPIAQAIGSKFKCVSDKMPPAYPCDSEKVVFVGIEMTGKVPQPVEQFCKDISPARTKSVAFYVVNAKGDTSGLEGVIKQMADKGVTTVKEILPITIKSSLFSKGKVSDEDITKALAWATKIAEAE